MNSVPLTLLVNGNNVNYDTIKSIIGSLANNIQPLENINGNSNFTQDPFIKKVVITYSYSDLSEALNKYHNIVHAVKADGTKLFK